MAIEKESISKEFKKATEEKEEEKFKNMHPSDFWKEVERVFRKYCKEKYCKDKREDK